MANLDFPEKSSNRSSSDIVAETAEQSPSAKAAESGAPKFTQSTASPPTTEEDSKTASDVLGHSDVYLRPEEKEAIELAFKLYDAFEKRDSNRILLVSNEMADFGDRLHKARSRHGAKRLNTSQTVETNSLSIPGALAVGDREKASQEGGQLGTIDEGLSAGDLPNVSLATSSSSKVESDKASSFTTSADLLKASSTADQEKLASETPNLADEQAFSKNGSDLQTSALPAESVGTVKGDSTEAFAGAREAASAETIYAHTHFQEIQVSPITDPQTNEEKKMSSTYEPLTIESDRTTQNPANKDHENAKEAIPKTSEPSLPAEGTIKPSPFGTETVLIEGQPVTTRTYEEGGVKWFEAFPLLRSVTWLPKSTQEKFVRRWIPKEDTLAVAQPSYSGSKTIHVNEEGLQIIQDTLKTIKPEYVKTPSDLPQKNDPQSSSTASASDQAPQKDLIVIGDPVTQSPIPLPKGCGLAEFLISDEVINTSVIKDKTGTWFATSELIANTKLARRRDIGKLLRKKVGAHNIKNIVLETPVGKRGKLYVNEEGVKKLLTKLEKSLDLIVLHDFKGASDSNPPPKATSPAPVAPSLPQPLVVEPDGTITFLVNGITVHAKTYTDESGLWIAARGLLNASKYAKRHDATKTLNMIVGKDNVRKLPQQTSTGRKEVNHVSEKALGKFLEAINGNLFHQNTQSTNSISAQAVSPSESPVKPLYKDTVFNDMSLGLYPTSKTELAEPVITPSGTSNGRYGSATLTFGSQKVSLPTYVDETGTWYCVYDLLKTAGFSTSKRRSAILRKAIRDGKSRSIHRQIENVHNNFNHLDMTGLKELLAELNTIPTQSSTGEVAQAIPPKKEKSEEEELLFPVEQLGIRPKAHKHPVFDEVRLGKKAPRPGDNSGVFTSLRVVIDNQALMVKSYTDNHKTWYATPDMFELVEIFDKERQLEILTDVLDKSDIKFIWQQYKDGLKLQPHIHKGALSTLVPVLNKVAQNARLPDRSSALNQKVDLDLPGAASSNNSHNSGWMPPRASDIFTQAGNSSTDPTELNVIRYGSERMEINDKAVDVKVIYDTAGTWFATWGLLSAAGIKSEENRGDFVKKVVSPEHIRPLDLTGNTTQIHVDRAGLFDILEAIGKLLGTKGKPMTQTTLSAGSAEISGTSNIGNNRMGILGATVIDLLGHQVTVKTATKDNVVWYSAVDVVDGFNAIEKADAKPLVSRQNLSHFVRNEVDAANIRQLFQRTANQPGTRPQTHINAEGLEQMKKAFSLVRSGEMVRCVVLPEASDSSTSNPSNPQVPTMPVPPFGNAPALRPGPVGIQGSPMSQQGLLQTNANIFQQTNAFPQPGGLPQQNSLQQPASFPQQTGYPQQAGFPQQSSFPQQSGFSQQSGLPQQSGFSQQGSPLSYGIEKIFLPNKTIEVRTVMDTNGKWYVIDDVLGNFGILKGTPHHKFVEDNIHSGTFRLFWQSGHLGIQKLTHINNTGLFEILNIVEQMNLPQQISVVPQTKFVQQPQVIVQRPMAQPTPIPQQPIPQQPAPIPLRQSAVSQQPASVLPQASLFPQTPVVQETVAHPEEKSQDSLSEEPKIRQSIYRSTETTPFDQRGPDWLKDEEARRGIIPYTYLGRKIRFVKDSAGVGYVNITDIMPYLHRGRIKTDASYLDPNGMVKVWTPSMKTTVGSIYINMPNLEKAIERVTNPEAKSFYEWCRNFAIPKLLAQPLIPIDL